MSVTDRVRRAQRVLQLIVASGSAFWAGAVLFAVLLVGAGISVLVAGVPRLVSGVYAIGVLSAAATFGALAWRGRFAWSFDRVALWIEERAPELRYALVTAVDPQYARATSPAVERLIARADVGSILRSAALRFTGPAVLAVVVLAGVFIALPDEWKQSSSARGFIGSAPIGRAMIGDRLRPVTVRITPPAYADTRARTLSDPSTIAGLQGSRVGLSGRGTPEGIRATLRPAGGEARSLRVAAGGNGWDVGFVMTDSAGALLKLTDRRYERLIVVDSRVDGSPTVRLRAPLRDTTLRVVSGTLQLVADLADDLGLATARFEYIVSSGSAETFTFKRGTLGERSLNSAKRGRIAASVSLSSLLLGEGDRLSVRAVSWDNNALSGPGVGYSETRTIRVARRDEYAAIAVTPAMFAADTSAISLRALIAATEELNRRRFAMDREPFVAEARRLAVQSEQIRQTIQRIIDVQAGGEHAEETTEADHEHGPSEQVAVSPLLVTALNAMWDATGKLEAALTAEALPPMYVAHRALQSLRTERRYYTRAAIRPIVVNIERVRLTGTDKGTATPRTRRPAERSDKERLRREYAAAVRLLRSAPDSTVALFTMLRVESLRSYPAISAALAQTLTAIEDGRDVTVALSRVRRLLEGPAVRLDSLPAWTGVW